VILAATWLGRGFPEPPGERSRGDPARAQPTPAQAELGAAPARGSAEVIAQPARAELGLEVAVRRAGQPR
jgi:hypothetical protein